MKGFIKFLNPPFGMLMPGRSSSNGNQYRYSFNGKEKDTEAPVQYDYGFRIYDPRLARFKSVDPLTKEYPMLTPYQYASNNPIQNIDIDGLEGGSSNGANTTTNNTHPTPTPQYSWQPPLPGKTTTQRFNLTLAGAAPLLNPSSVLRAIPGGLGTWASTAKGASTLLGLGLRLGGTIACVLIPTSAGSGSNWTPWKRWTEWTKPYVPAGGTIGAPFSIVSQPSGSPLPFPISPTQRPGNDDGGNPMSLIYETERSRKFGERLGYFGITQLSFTGDGGRYGSLKEEALNLKGFIGIAPRNVALGVEQSLLELNNGGQPYPRLSNRIDNFNNAISPDNPNYVTYKKLGQVYLNLWWPDWQTRFLKPTLPERRAK